MISSRLSTVARCVLSDQLKCSLRCISNLPKVKIVTENDDRFLKISFKYGALPYNQNNLNLVVPKAEELHAVLSRIKLMVSLQRKKEYLRRAVMDKFAGNKTTDSNNGTEEEEEVTVCLMHNNKLLEDNMLSMEAWTEGSLLKIGNNIYEVNENIPTVLNLSLPTYIVPGCDIRAHTILECCESINSLFMWYRSVSEAEVEKWQAMQREIQEENGKYWLKVHEGFIYHVSRDDIGRNLRVVCTPIHGDRSGVPISAESAETVENISEVFPFEERHAYTKELVDNHSIRCITYNVLANVYVETKKFPYCSKKAKDVYYRKQLLMKELLGYNGDVICLQEVQGRVFEFDLMPVLQQAGFDGFYTRKGGRRYEGLACFFRTSKFKLVSSQGILLNEAVKERDIFANLLNKVSGNTKDMSKLLNQDTALQIICLEHKDEPHRRIMVANTHLYSNKDTPEVRLLQSAMCVSYIEHVLKTEDLQNAGLLFCGDFNSLPDSAAVVFLKGGSFQCCESWKKSAVDSSTDAILRHSLTLDSACGIPEYTNYTQLFYGCLDYIFYSANTLNVTDIVPMPSHETVTKEVALPSETFPSDHIALVCTLKWK